MAEASSFESPAQKRTDASGVYRVVNFSRGRVYNRVELCAQSLRH